MPTPIPTGGWPQNGPKSRANNFRVPAGGLVAGEDILILENIDFFKTNRQFLKSIGIDYPGQPPHFERTYLGKIEVEEGGFIELSVMATPAEFWYAEIVTIEGKSYSLGTGSGDLETFWPSFILVAEGMLSIRENQS